MSSRKPVPVFHTFEEFWPYYLGEHSNATCRALHYFGTSSALIFAVFAVTYDIRLLPLGFVLGYGPAWVGHFFIEKNRPATFTYPLWSFRGDFRMLGYAITGKLKAELDKLNSNLAKLEA